MNVGAVKAPTIRRSYPWIGCECCKGTVWVPFKMNRAANFVMVAETLTELLQSQLPQSDARPTPAFPQDQIEFEFDRKVRRCRAASQSMLPLLLRPQLLPYRFAGHLL